LQERLLTELEAKRTSLTADQERNLVLGILCDQISGEVDSKVTTHRRQVVTALENWWGKYAPSLHQIEHERDAATTKLVLFLTELGYE
jgi:type I restriction enzyme M protein